MPDNNVLEIKDLVQANYAWVEASKYKSEMYQRIQSSNILLYELLKIAKNELSKIKHEMQLFHDSGIQDSETYWNCYIWGNAHLQVAKFAFRERRRKKRDQALVLEVVSRSILKNQELARRGTASLISGVTYGPQ